MHFLISLFPSKFYLFQLFNGRIINGHKRKLVIFRYPFGRFFQRHEIFRTTFDESFFYIVPNVSFFCILFGTNKFV